MSLWHHRLSPHCLQSLIHSMVADGRIPRHQIDLSHSLPFCHSCAATSIRQVGPIANGAPRGDQASPVVSRILEEVLVDVSGPYPLDRSGNRWFVLFVDRKSRFRYVGLMRHKNDTMSHFLSFCKSATRQHPNVSIDDLTAVRMDGGNSGGEFSGIRDYAMIRAPTPQGSHRQAQRWLNMTGRLE